MRLLFYIWEEEVNDLLTPVRLARVDFLYEIAKCQYYDARDHMSQTMRGNVRHCSDNLSLLAFVVLAPSYLSLPIEFRWAVPNSEPWVKQVYSALHVKISPLRERAH